MICLCLADLHYDLRKFDWVVAAAPAVDLVVLAGDHLELASMVARPAQAVVVRKYLARIARHAPLIVSSGNHDLDGRDPNGELACRWLSSLDETGPTTDGGSLRLADTLFTVCPWVDGEGGRNTVTRLLERDAARRPDRWVWIHHAPPAGSATSWSGARSLGDAWLREWIERFGPDIVLAGHVHQAPFTRRGCWTDRIGRTRIFNAGHQYGPTPSAVFLDTGRRVAHWSSLAAIEAVSLDGADPTEPIRAAPSELPVPMDPGFGPADG